MRVAVVCESFSALSETFIYDYVVALKSMGTEVDIAALHLANPIERPFDNVHWVNPPGRLHPYKLVADCNPAWLGQRLVTRWCGGVTSVPDHELYQRIYRSRLTKLLRKLRPDVVHAEFGPMGVLVRPVVEFLALPLVVSFHGHDASKLLRTKLWRSRYRKVFEVAEATLCPSYFIRDKLLAAGAPSATTHVVRNGIRLDSIAYSAPAERFDGQTVRFVFVGRLVPKKDPISLLKAFARCREMVTGEVAVSLTLVGDGPLLARLTDAVSELGLSGAVHLTGALPHPEVLRILQRSHIYVHYSVTTADGETEGLPVSIAEAAASGLPVITTHHSGIPELVVNGDNGYLVNEGDTDGLADRMAELSRQPSLWGPLGLAGRQRIEQHFEISRVTTQMHHILANAAGISAHE